MDGGWKGKKNDKSYVGKSKKQKKGKKVKSIKKFVIEQVLNIKGSVREKWKGV